MKEEKMRTTKMRGWIIIMVLMFGLIGAFQLPVSHEATAGQDNGMMKSKELELRGKQLRKAIDETYKKLADAKALKSMGNGRNIITDTVVKYIPIGTSFDDAEAILRAAGFEVGKRDMNPIIHNDYGVYSKINHYKLTLPFGNTSVSVFLQPKNKDDWSVVQGLEADINIMNYI
jgi:hypothetical protein